MRERPRPPSDPAGPSSLRWLTACPACRAQFDVSEIGVGSRFHCGCGTVVSVPPRRSHEAEVVRCSSCGAPRSSGARRCAHCRADFAGHERHRHTICPACAGRIDDRARYCHACGIAIAPQPVGERSDLTCPACPEPTGLSRRILASHDPVPLHECPVCAGLWLDGETFRRLEGAARRDGVSWLSSQTTPYERPPSERAWSYRKCPSCATVMHRRNYGRKSGVVVDLCDRHGIWFDDRELERILAWVRDGGPARARLAEDDTRARTGERPRPVPEGGSYLGEDRGADIGELLRGLLGRLFRP